MKILITFYFINNYGGIINNQEGLYRGLRALGHEVDVRVLYWKDRVKAVRSTRRLIQERSEMGCTYDQEAGWSWPERNRFAYKGKTNLKRWKEFASKYDMVIWQIPVPSANREMFGNQDWLELYDLPESVKQVAYVHDGNFHEMYPWLYAIKDKLHGAVGVHPCAYNSLNRIDIPRALILSPQYDVEQRLQSPRKKGRDGWFSLQTFKGWKHVPDIVRAVPHMGPYPKRLAGGGINYYYMTSEEKTLPRYLDENGNRIWDNAIDAGMEYLGYLTNAQREEYLGKAKVLIDPSWSKKYARIGDHVNRVAMDAIVGGCVLVARNLGISTNEEGEGFFFKPNRHYIMIPWDASPVEFADIIDGTMNMSASARDEMVDAAREEILPHAEYKSVAQTFIDVGMGKKKAGSDGKVKTGKFDEELARLSDLAINTHFAGKTKWRAAAKEDAD